MINVEKVKCENLTDNLDVIILSLVVEVIRDIFVEGEEERLVMMTILFVRYASINRFFSYKIYRNT